MAWDDDLSPEQRRAAVHVGSHARVLAGPGTGKTRVLTRRICYLVEEQNVDPNNILALTFTRAAAHELRRRVEDEVGIETMPRIATLHSFALRQLLRNSRLITALPQPLRIADDWEERHIILEDLKSLLGLDRIERARDLLNALSADWQTLTADEGDWEKRFPDPAFLGAWQEHRERYGYVLRAELVYQLKRAIEQHGRFNLEGPLAHLLVDEYQDLNRCDLALVRGVVDRGAEVFVAGDDDQSIYGFRKAHPEGIRRFPKDYTGAQDLPLETCKRCDPNILDLGLFVARQDYARIEKPIHPDAGRVGGEVALLRFPNGGLEAEGVAQLSRYLLERQGLQPEQILILLRSDRNGVFSSLIRQSLERAGVPVVAATAETNPLGRAAGRQVLAFLRVMENAQDHLAWRTLIKLRPNNLGPAAVDALYKVARIGGTGFAQAVRAVSGNPSIIAAPHGARIQAEVTAVQEILEEFALPENDDGAESGGEIIGLVQGVVEKLVDAGGERHAILEEFQRAADASEATSISELFRAIEASNDAIEQEVERGKVNILTMHKAKGLTAEAVIIAAAEDEYLPGRAQGEGEGDERRLLYVSLTRAKHFLYVAYCERRTGRQRYTGRNSGRSRRSLTRFLRDAPIAPQSGTDYVRGLLAQQP